MRTAVRRSVGTLATLILLGAVVHRYASRGTHSFRAEFRRRVAQVLATPPPDGVVCEADLAPLPDVVAAYVRRSGAVGRPRVGNFHARVHGRIRGGPHKPWMRFTAEQVNGYAAQPNRLFHMDATMFGLPVDVLHVFVGSSATMRAKLCSLVPLVDAAGPDMDRAETVTLFNDLCVLAPAALVDAAVSWRPIDDHRVEGRFSDGVHTVNAVLVFDDDHDLVDFVSDDRLRASPDGTSFTQQRWSTPLRDYRTVGGRRLASFGEGRWHAGGAEGQFAYLEFQVDDITYNVGAAAASGSAAERAGAAAP